MSEDSKISKAQQKAVHKYVKNNYDRIELTVKPKGKKEELKAHAEKNGETLNSFINRAINEAMERDAQKIDCQEKEPYSPLPETDTRNTQFPPNNASGKTFEEKREQLLKEFEALASTSGQEMSGSPAGSRHKHPESDPVTSPYETLDEKLERLRKEHSTQAPIGSNE